MYGRADARLRLRFLLHFLVPVPVPVLVPVSLGVLVLALEGVQAGFEAQGVDVGQVGGAVQVQARQDLHVSDPGRVELQQLLHPL